MDDGNPDNTNAPTVVKLPSFIAIGALLRLHRAGAAAPHVEAEVRHRAVQGDPAAQLVVSWLDRLVAKPVDRAGVDRGGCDGAR
ncbi:hypothetical protein [Consotaella salsifontis]|nr:hypothetical protein [Consotaella salsifontis]